MRQRDAGSAAKENAGDRRPVRVPTVTAGCGIAYPTATHVEALKENFLDGEFDPPPSPPSMQTRISARVAVAIAYSGNIKTATIHAHLCDFRAFVVAVALLGGLYRKHLRHTFVAPRRQPPPAVIATLHIRKSTVSTNRVLVEKLDLQSSV